MTDSLETTNSHVTRVTEDDQSVGPAGTAPSMAKTSDMPEVNKSATGVENSVDDPPDNNDKKVKSAKKNICFRELSLATYSEAPDPWKYAESWDNKDLLAAYRKGCEQNNVRPLNKVLQQLQGIQNTGDRHDLLSLKGERLDMRHCESLEEVFRRVQFKCVDVEACHLDDETSVALFDMFEYYESACKVNMSFNKNVSVRGWQSCSRMIRKTPCLYFLDARNCDLNDRLIPIMGRALRIGTFLTTLHLESASLSGRPLVILVAALKMNEILVELFLADNRLMPSDGIQLGNLLKYNHKLQLLDIRNNHLQDIGASHTCDGLCEQNQGAGLQTIVLWNNQITYQAMTSVGKAMAATESVETLNLGHNNVTNEGIHLMKEGLLKSKSLLRIGLQGTKVTCEGAVALAEVIADSPRLLRLDLRENDIKTAGLMALSLALKVNETVTRLDMDRDTKRESAMKGYAEQQKRLQQDINNFLDRNQGLMRKRTEEERLNLERTIKEDTRMGRSDSFIEPAESAMEDSQTIASFDKIKRPMLLVVEDRATQKTLDSPHVKPEAMSDSEDDEPSVLPSHKSLAKAAAPPTELLLSPQYCTVKAKKLFTVSRVAGPPPRSLPQTGMNAGHSVSSPLDSVLSPMDSNDLISHNSSTGLSARNITSPSDITHSLETESVNHMIEEIVTGVLVTDDQQEEEAGKQEVVLETEKQEVVSGDETEKQEVVLETEKQEVVLGDETEKQEVVLETEKQEVVLGDETEKQEVVLGDETEKQEVVLEEETEKQEVVLEEETEKQEVVLGVETEKQEVVLGDETVKQEIVLEEMREKEVVLGEERADNSSVAFQGQHVTCVEYDGVVCDTTRSADENCINIVDQSRTNTEAGGIEECVPPSNTMVSVSTNNSVCDNSKAPLGNLDSAIQDVLKGDNSVTDKLSGGIPELDVTDCDQTQQNGEIETFTGQNSRDNLSNSLPCDKLKQEKDSGIGSYENDREWTRLDAPNKGVSTNGCDSRKDCPGLSKNSPDFYSDLSLNGLTQELASALENLDVDSTTGKDSLSVSEPADDFEKELDDMLADVKSGSNLNLPSCLTSNTE